MKLVLKEARRNQGCVQRWFVEFPVSFHGIALIKEYEFKAESAPNSYSINPIETEGIVLLSPRILWREGWIQKFGFCLLFCLIATGMYLHPLVYFAMLGIGMVCGYQLRALVEFLKEKGILE